MLGLAVVNLNSLVNKVTFVNDLIRGSGLSALAVCETLLTSEISSSYVAIPGFRFFRKDVLGIVRKHGVGLYIKDSLRVAPCDVEPPNVLSVLVEEWGVHLVVVYRPPSYSQRENEALLEFVAGYTVNKNVIILGDFNLPSLKWGSTEMLRRLYHTNRLAFL